MSECNITVDPGVCKMNAKIHAEPSEDMMSVVVTIDSPCKMIKAFAEALKPVGAYDEFTLPMVQNPVYITASEHITHSACPIPCAVLKAIEVALEQIKTQKSHKDLPGKPAPRTFKDLGLPEIK